MTEFQERSVAQSWYNLRYVIYGITALMLALAHVIILNLISVSGITPDLLTILVVWIALREGQFTGIIAGFLCGLLFDLVSYDVIGTNALAKTFAGFIAGFFYKEKNNEYTLGSLYFILAILASSFVHNLIYFFFYIRPTEMTFWNFFFRYGIASTLYTTVAALFPMLVKSRNVQN
ncbi:MAG: rod shape-determining protein MreD [Ignavibacteria bacterium]|jgi:rod shape-determining protein MreD|nr:rod shape-determining protein MreD [Chlorobiota bacterium]